MIFQRVTNPVKFIHDRKTIKNIIYALSFTDIMSPYFKYKFILIYHAIVACNDHMEDLFIPIYMCPFIYLLKMHLTRMYVLPFEYAS